MDKLSSNRWHRIHLHRYNAAMKPSGDIYAFSRESILEEHAGRLEGNREGLVLVVFTEPLNDAATNALQKSFNALGYGNDANLYANIDGLSRDAVFDLVEGIDPLALVACDAKAVDLCSQAVRQPFPPMQKTRLFGREARAFAHLNTMFETEMDKQAVWHQLKSMV